MTHSLRSTLLPGVDRRLTAFSVFAVAAGVTLALAVASPAAAHNAVVSATPEEGEVLTAVPEVFEVVTNEAMLDLGGDAAGFGMLVTDAAGLYYGDGCIMVEGDGMSMPATLGAPGDYTFTFQYVSADGHTLSGEYDFSYTPEGEQLFSDGSVEPPLCGGAGAGAEPSAPAAPSESPAPSQGATDDPALSPPAEPAPGEADVPSDAADLSPAVIIALAVAALAAVIAVVFAVRRGRRTDDAA